MTDILPSLENSLQSSALLQLLDKAGARGVLAEVPGKHSLSQSVMEDMPFPFLAIVKQNEMRIALLLTVINPAVGGVLLIGPRGTGKTTCIRSLHSILPEVPVSMCENGCLPEYMAYNPDKICDACQAKLDAGEPIARLEPVRLIELPLNTRLDDVVGGVNERIAVQQNRVRLEKGILAHADKNLLYIDEVNLLDDTIIDAILDASAQGQYTVRRGAMVGTYRSRFVLIGSMNPEEGRLRPQILDRFGLRVVVSGMDEQEDRIAVYERVRQYRTNPQAFAALWAEETHAMREEISLARMLLKDVTLDEDALHLGIALVNHLKLDSHRSEHTMFEAARAHAAADGRIVATVDDIKVVAPLALRQRRSMFMIDFFAQQQEEDQTIRDHLNDTIGKK